MMTIIAGDKQDDTVGRELPAAITVQVTNAQTLAPLPGVLINWHVVSGGGSVFAGTALTDVLGMARERWTLGPIVGEQAMEARMIDSLGNPIVYARVTATAKPDVATHFDLVGPYHRVDSEYVAVDRVFPDESFFLAVIYGDRYSNITPACADGGSLDRLAWPVMSDGLQVVGSPVAGSVAGIRFQEFVYSGTGGIQRRVEVTSECVPGHTAFRVISVDYAP
ncbi:MAG TPA: hypothetical protein VGQ06_02180 [Gemmatimonadales bacterium]|jgi:hypothetical protein|nr:hypothetical protein [Gemmatimonadales bacterium]